MTYYPLFDGWKKDHGDAFLTLLSDMPHTSPYLLLEGAANQEGEISREDRQRLLLRCLTESRSPYLWQRILKEALLSDMPLFEFADILGLEDFCVCCAQAAGQLPFSQISKVRRAAADLERTRPLPGIWLYRLFLKKELTQGYLMGDTLRETLEAYGQCTLRFYQEQYREDLFSEANRALLPKDCRFAFLLLEALQALQAEELPQAIRLFHSAIRLGPDLTGVIREILREAKEDGEAPGREGAEEFQSLAGQMKASIEGMAEKGAYEEALSLVAQLSPLLPKDLELLRLRQRLLCQMNRTSRLKDLALWEE